MDTPTPKVYAHVADGIVVNTCLWDGVSDYEVPEGIELVLMPTAVYDGVEMVVGGIGWTYNPKATVHKFVDNRPTEEPS
jgi:hypothetical protein